MSENNHELPQEPVALEVVTPNVDLQTEVVAEKTAPRKPSRLPMTAAADFRTMALPEEALSDEEVSSGPVDNPNVTQSMNHNLIPPEPFIVQEALGIPHRTHMFFLPEQGEEFDRRMMQLVKQPALDTQQGQAWNASLMIAHALTAQTGMVQSDAQRRENSRWEQTLKTESNSFGFTAPKFAEESTPLVDGIRARIRVRALMGNGGVITVPLMKSGFWLTLHAPTDSAWYELQRRFNDDKISYGRRTNGMIFSNEQVYMNSWLLEFCLDHVYDATVKYADSNELRGLIDALDLPVLFAGMARLMYPRGFNYVRSVATASGIEGMQMIQGKLDISKLLWIDNSFLTARQRNHMANRVRSTVTPEQLADYRKDFALSEGREVKLSDSISLILKSPSAESYIDDGDRWIEGVVTMVDETFTTTRPTESERNEVINRHATMAQMVRYASFVHAVRFDGLDHTHMEAKENILRTLSEEAAFVKIFDTEIKRFIADSTAAMIAIPETAGHDGVENHPRFPNLIPLDVVTVFFTLLAQKL